MIPDASMRQIATTRHRELLAAAEQARRAVQAGPSRTVAPAVAHPGRRRPALAHFARSLLTNLASSNGLHRPRTVLHEPAPPSTRPQGMASGVTGG